MASLAPPGRKSVAHAPVAKPGRGKIATSVHSVIDRRGEPLPSPSRAFFQSRFGSEIGNAVLHTGPAAADSARALDARAYTVGRHIVFAEGEFAPSTAAGSRLLAHELTHVKQQAGASVPRASLAVSSEGSSLEREAHANAENLLRGNAARVSGRAPGAQIQRHKNDLVAYSGGQSGIVGVFAAGQFVRDAQAVSGHPGHTEWEVNVGPVPEGKYAIHPRVTQPAVSKSVPGAVCGAPPIPMGYQTITSTDPTPCASGSAHYCNVPCPSAANAAQLCWTPRDCWGGERIRIEGSTKVVTPAGGTQTRDGFYLHGGNPTDAVSSGCIKALEPSVFADIRKLSGVKGKVTFCVGAACPEWARSALTAAQIVRMVEAVETFFGGSRDSDE